MTTHRCGTCPRPAVWSWEFTYSADGRTETRYCCDDNTCVGYVRQNGNGAVLVPLAQLPDGVVSLLALMQYQLAFGDTMEFARGLGVIAESVLDPKVRELAEDMLRRVTKLRCTCGWTAGHDSRCPASALYVAGGCRD